MTETTEEELNRINPQRNWNWRKTKRRMKKRGSRLYEGGYAMGCRGHPGIITKSNFWYGWSFGQMMNTDVSIKSLIDGVEESCSIFSCAPMPMSKEDAEFRAEEIRTVHGWDLSAKYSGFSIGTLKGWLKAWIDQGVLYYVLHDQEGYVVCSAQAFTKEDAEEEVKRLQADWIIEKGVITNPRIVDMLTYPVPLTFCDVNAL